MYRVGISASHYRSFCSFINDLSQHHNQSDTKSIESKVQNINTSSVIRVLKQSEAETASSKPTYIQGENGLSTFGYDVEQ